MKLHPFHRVIAVAQPHHQTVIGLRGNGQDVGHRRSLHNERVVSGGFDGVGESGENPFSGVVDNRRLAVHYLRCSNHPAAENLPEALQSEAHTEQGPHTAELLDDGVAQPGIGRLSRPGADENTIGIDVEGLVEGDGVVAIDKGLCAQLTEVLDQVVDEGVIVVDHQYAGSHRGQRYRGAARG